MDLHAAPRWCTWDTRGTTAALEQLLRYDSDAWRLPQDRTMRGRDEEFEDALRCSARRRRDAPCSGCYEAWPGGLEISPAGIRPAAEAARGCRPALGHRAWPADPARSSRSAPCWAGRSAATTSPPCSASHRSGCSRTSRPRWAPTCSWPRRSRAGQADRADLRFPPGNRRRWRQHLEAGGGRRWRRTWPRPAHDADLHGLCGARASRRRHHSADEPDCALSSTRSGELNHPPRRRSLTHVACPAQPDHCRPVAAQ
jgi:hypothetical protein